MPNGMPVALMRCLARLMRWAMVASGTRKALAISPVVRPPTALSVRAIWEAGDSAGWQHRKRRVRVSSCSADCSSPGAGARAASADAVAATLSSRRRMRRTGRSGERARRGPAAPAGAAGPRCGRPSSHLYPARLHERSHLHRPVAGVRPARRDLGCALDVLTLEKAEAHQMLLGLEVRSVRDRGYAVSDLHGLGLRRVGQAVSANPLPGFAELLHDGVDVV